MHTATEPVIKNEVKKKTEKNDMNKTNDDFSIFKSLNPKKLRRRRQRRQPTIQRDRGSTRTDGFLF